MELILTDRTYRSIINECSSVAETETGGILIGKRIDEQRIVVPFSLGPGFKAKRSWIRFSPDVQWQQVYLEKLFNRYGVNYVGSYHRHPGNDYLPSHLDLKTVRRITCDPEWNAPEAVFPIITMNDNKINFYPYHFSRAAEGFQLIDWRIVNHNDRLVKSTLKRSKNQ